MKLAVIQSLLALCLLPLGSNFAQAQKPEDTARLLKTLLQDYKAYGLPLIPEKAQLAVIETEVPNLVKPEELWLYRHVVFVTRDAKHQSWLVQPPLTHLKIKWKLQQEMELSHK